MRLVILFILLTLPQLGQGQYIYWNNVYPLSDPNGYEFKVNLLAKDSTFESLGVGWINGEYGWTRRTVDNLGLELFPIEIAASSIGSSPTLDMYTSIPDGGYITINSKELDSGPFLFYPYLCKLSAEFDTIWTRDLAQIGHDHLQRFPIGVQFANEDTLVLLTNAFLMDENFQSLAHGFGISILNNDGVLLSDTINWMEEDYYFDPGRMRQLPMGDYLICGLFSHNEFDSFISKINLAGDILEELILGNPDNCIDSEINFNLVNDSTLIVAYNYCYDYENSVQKISKPHLMSFNPITWQVNWDEEYNLPEFEGWGGGYNFQEIVTCEDGGYAVCIVYYPFPPNPENPYPSGILRTDSLGTLEWFKTYVPSLGNYSGASDMVVAHDGGFVVTGVSYVFIDEIGEIQEQRNWMFKTDPCGDLEWVDCPGGVGLEEISLESINTLLISPNPIQNNRFNIQSSGLIQSIRILDMTGKLMHTQKANATNVEVYVPGLASGSYLVECQFENGERKSELVMVKERE